MEVNMRGSILALIVLLASAAASANETKYYDLAKGDYPHDVAISESGEVWFAGQKAGIAGRLDPKTGAIERLALGKNSAPHGFIVEPDVAPWFTDVRENANVIVAPPS